MHQSGHPLLKIMLTGVGGGDQTQAGESGLEVNETTQTVVTSWFATQQQQQPPRYADPDAPPPPYRPSECTKGT